MKNFKFVIVLLVIALMVASLTLPAFASEAPDATVGEGEEQTAEAAETDNTVSAKAIAAAVSIGVACAVGALSMALAISKSTESMARQPEIAGKINSSMMLGLVFIETAIIYALIVAIIIIFVL